jgi:hypothetical protein
MQLHNHQIFQWYKCESCGLIRSVTLPAECSTLYALNNLKADHAEHSPSCLWNIDNITVYTNNTLALRELNTSKGESNDDK